MHRQELLTVREVSALLKVPESWLYSRTRQSGKDTIPRIKVGKYLRFKESEVMEWIKKKYGEIQS